MTLSFFENFYLELLSVISIGLFTMPLLPLSLDFGCELSFPIGEALSTGVLMTGGNFVGII
jgi:FLVCR family feline leukemia virus subgroup C receptor-related protein